MSSTTAIKSQSSGGDWDAHGFGANKTIQLNKLSATKKYKLSNINFLNPATREVVDEAHESFRGVIGLRPGGTYTKNELTQVLDALSSSVFFEKIEFDAKTNPDGTVDLNVPYKERVYPSKTMFRCLSVGMLPEEEPIEPIDPASLSFEEEHELIEEMENRRQQRIERAGVCILPEQVQDEIEWTLRQKPFVRASLLSRITSRIQNWYHDHGYSGARVVNLANLENRGGEIIFEVNEGDITDVGVRFVDKMGNTTEGKTNIKLIKRALPDELAVGRAFTQRAFDRAKQNISNLNLFSYVNIHPHQDETTGAMSAEIVITEESQGVKTEWSAFSGPHSLSKIESIRPGATLQFVYPNIEGRNRSLRGAITLGNLFVPAEADIEYILDYTHPYLDGIDNPRNRTFGAAFYGSRKLSSPVFGRKYVAPIWVDREGIKATITEDYTKQSKFTYGLVLEDIETSEKNSQIAAKGNGELAFLQANLTRDNTRFVNSALVGARDVFEVDQGIGIGTKFAIFNRTKVSATRFIPLMKVKEGEGNAAPPTLVLHGLLGKCFGDLPNHEAFAIGGPNSVRGYDVGEIGVSTSKLEVAAEVRIPVKKATVYGFAEHGNDLGSTVGLEGKMCHGTSYGVGVKYGPVRAEYAVDHNKREGAFWFGFGDRF